MKMMSVSFAQLAMISASVTALTVATAPAAAQTQTRPFNIPAQSLSSAILEFSRQADVIVIVAPELTAGKRSVAVKGNFPVNVAIANLLQASGLRATPNPNGGYRVGLSQESPARKKVFGTLAGESADLASVQTTTSGAGLTSTGQVVRTADEAGSDILVTGSRIANSDLASTSPLATTLPEAFKQTGAVTLEQTLNKAPQLVAADTANSNDYLTGGISTLSLRGLGSPRTLVLLDSHRIVPSVSDGSIDINMIPDALLSKVEVITGGASSTYGSDAIAGVVNFKLDHNFKGLVLDAQSGITSRGDDPSYKFSAAWGSKIGDRGHVVASIQYADRKGLINQDRTFSAISRPSLSLAFGNVTQTVGNTFSQAAVDAVFAKYGAAAGTVPATTGVGFNNDGTVFKFTNGLVNYRGAFTNGYSVQNGSLTFASTGNNFLVSPFTNVSAYGAGDYEIFDDVTAYISGGFYHDTDNQRYAGVGFTINVPVTNPFIPNDLATLLASRPNPTAPFSVLKRYTSVGYRDAHFSTDNFQVSGGFKGKLGLGDWTWDLYGSYGEVNQKRLATGFINTAAITSILTAPDGGQSLCTGGINPFGDLPFSASCVDFINRTATSRTIFTEGNAEANFQGKVISLPAGDLRAAVGADYRRDSYVFRPDAQLAAGLLQGLGDPSVPASGSDNVYELYGELLVPILRDLPLVKRLNADLSYRYSHYNTAGGVHTFKANGQWSVTSAIMFRGGYSRAIRAPSLGELYSPQAAASPTIGLAGAPGQGDPCDVNSAYRKGANGTQVRSLCLAQGVPQSLVDSYTFPASLLLTGISGGNPNLKPEDADTYTAGVVLTPHLGLPIARTISFSADYFHINVKNVIGIVSGPLEIQKCYNYDGSNPTYSPSNVYCGFLGRDANTGQLSRVSTINANLGDLETSGIDIAATWGFGLDAIGIKGNLGSLTLTAMATYLREYNIQNFPGGATTNYIGSIGPTPGSNAHPKWKSVLDVTYSLGKLSVTGEWRRINHMKDASTVGVANATTPGVPTYNYFDLNIRVGVFAGMAVRFGVTNLTDKQPPVFTSFIQSNTDPGTYDVIGRAFYFGINKKF